MAGLAAFGVSAREKGSIRTVTGWLRRAAINVLFNG